MKERENLYVCSKCLMAIESHEGTQATLRHAIDLTTENVEEESKCDWCQENGFDTLYELI